MRGDDYDVRVLALTDFGDRPPYGIHARFETVAAVMLLGFPIRNQRSGNADYSDLYASDGLYKIRRERLHRSARRGGNVRRDPREMRVGARFRQMLEPKVELMIA